MTFSFHHETAHLRPKRDRWHSKAFSQVIQGPRHHGCLVLVRYELFKRQHNYEEKDGFKTTP
jgi:hypothetical protein